ncbi:MAG: acyl carrier protein [bacterium]|nr:acyl carrier protein [bacterium]
MPDVHDRLVRCFATVLPALDPAQIATAVLGEAPGWDSLATINLMLVIEEEFGVQLSLDELPDLTSFARIKAHLEKEAAA